MPLPGKGKFTDSMLNLRKIIKCVEMPFIRKSIIAMPNTHHQVWMKSDSHAGNKYSISTWGQHGRLTMVTPFHSQVHSHGCGQGLAVQLLEPGPCLLPVVIWEPPYVPCEPLQWQEGEWWTRRRSILSAVRNFLSLAPERQGSPDVCSQPACHTHTLFGVILFKEEIWFFYFQEFSFLVPMSWPALECLRT